MAQYRSHTPDTLSYMESYLQTIDRTKDIFLKFRTSKATRTRADRQDLEIRELMADQRAKKSTIEPSLIAIDRLIKRGLNGPIGGRI